MNSNLGDFKQFMTERQHAAKAYVCGDAQPLDRLVTEQSPATFFGPGGTYQQGADEVISTYNEGAKHFGPNGETHFEILHMAASENIAYWVGIQHAFTKMRESEAPAPQDLRVTEIFRREDGEWKLIHRHADLLKAEKPSKTDH